MDDAQLMLFQKRYWEPIRSGEITVTYRRWKRSQVVAERIYRSSAGRLLVTSVDLVPERSISDADARRSGYPDAATLVADLRGTPGDDVFRIEFRHVDEPDPRDLLAANADLTPDGIDELNRRLDRLDKASSHGPWTRQYLEAIASQPGVRAPDLAASFGRETQPFKTDVRKLKNLGLTISLERGYRISPRGEAYLSSRE